MLKKFLMAFGMLVVAGSAAAEDITNPFYLPFQGQFGSVTSASIEKFILKNDAAYVKSHKILAQEDIQFGLTDTLSFTAGIGNIWDWWKGTPKIFLDGLAGRTMRDSENIFWNAGLAWDALSGPTRLQFAAQYGQNRWKNFDGEYKYVSGEARFGYQFKRVLPYITGAVEVPLWQKSGTKGIAGDKLIYNTKLGLYQGKCETWALDTGVRLKYDENAESRLISAEAEASYYLTPKASLGVYGTYALDGYSKYDLDVHDKSAGVRLRLYF